MLLSAVEFSRYTTNAVLSLSYFDHESELAS